MSLSLKQIALQILNCLNKIVFSKKISPSNEIESNLNDQNDSTNTKTYLFFKKIKKLVLIITVFAVIGILVGILMNVCQH
jgi:hypothetical protein